MKVHPWVSVTAIAISMSSMTGDQHAHADNHVKNYPASVCVQTSVGGTMTYNFSGIGNTSIADNLEVDCPYVRDQPLLYSAIVYVLDKHGSRGVTCSMNMTWTFVDDPTVYTLTPASASSTGSASRHQTLVMLGGGRGAGGDDYGHRYISCSIPPTQNGKTSYVESFEITEADL